MSTHSAIIMKRPDGIFAGIYCHFDGYPEGVGMMLRDHYQDANKVAALIQLGDISSLDMRVDPIGPHSYKEPEDGTTVAYGRDRGEEDTEFKIGSTWKEVAAQIAYQYVYVFDNGWTLYE